MERKTAISRKLRKSMTDAELMLWSKVKNDQMGFRFRRQHSLGIYVADFYCYECRLVIEVDGGQHNESQADVVRDKFFEGQGIKILRFWNNEVLENIDGVIHQISLSLNPSPEGRGRIIR